MEKKHHEEEQQREDRPNRLAVLEMNECTTCGFVKEGRYVHLPS